MLFLCMGAPFQEMALGKKGGLIYLTCEQMVFGCSASEEPCPVPIALVHSWNAARQAANQLVEASGAEGGKHMQEVLGKKENMLQQIGRSFKVEFNFLASLAEGGGAQQQTIKQL